MTRDPRPVSQINLDPATLEMEVELANDFCSNSCPVRESLLQRRLNCPFILRQALGGRSPGEPLEFHVIKDVVQNTWIHCVSDVRRQDEPVILINEGQVSYSIFKEYLG